MTSDDELKSLFHRAAEMVKDLPEALQAEAFNRAFESLRGDVGPTVREAQRRTRKRASKSQPATRKGSRKRSSPTRLKDLNLRPRDGRSLVDFAEEKQPGNDHERKLVAVYYLERILEIGAITVDHVYSCFKEMNWKIPANLPNSLQLTAARKAWLDTSDMSSIRVAIPGENYVEQDLPRNTQKK